MEALEMKVQVHKGQEKLQILITEEKKTPSLGFQHGIFHHSEGWRKWTEAF